MPARENKTITKEDKKEKLLPKVETQLTRYLKNRLLPNEMRTKPKIAMFNVM
jgi:hypothetical protein